MVHYIAKVREFNLRGLIGVAGILTGAGVIKLFNGLGGPTTTAYWWYPVGLLVGAVVIAALAGFGE